ncbi:protein ALP1-like [Xenia sp. Carnegie-2017]|uniref:protein ALP1-like n=1 Tax=Xenia sp. Carnegie-2017 TaxID=2897299 RepID=UPI001F04526B|nr:protein ALP1-like [Xenia sp. Carnegie-2017]
MQLGDHESFFKYFRMSPIVFEKLLQLVTPLIIKSNQKREAILPAERLSVTLRYLATGDSHQTISFSYRLGHSAVNKIVPETCLAIWKALSPIYVQCPSTTNEWEDVAKEFWEKWKFPLCIGALDGKHVRCHCPANTGSLYFNFHGWFSVVLMAVCSAHYSYLLVNIGAIGSSSDGGVFERCGMKDALYNGRLSLPEDCNLPNTNTTCSYVITADDAFPLGRHVMKPYGGRYLEHGKRIFNYRLSRARRVSENTFGISTARWRIFKRPIYAIPERCIGIVKAVVALHNFLMFHESTLPRHERRYCPPGFVDSEEKNADIVPRAWREDVNKDTGYQSLTQTKNGNACKKSAKEIRDIFKNFFNSPAGAVPWQNVYINK